MTQLKTKLTAFSVSLVLALAAADSAFAQAYPSKPVRLVVPFPGGSITDTFMRVFTDKMQVSLGQPIIVDPRPGGGTVIGTQFALQQPADGYTMLLVTSSQEIRSAAPNATFDIRKDANMVVRTHYGPLVFAINPDKLQTVKTLQDFVDYAKANPGVVNFGSYGTGSLAHLAQALFVSQTGINVVHVPYNGSAADVTALVRGDSHIALDAMGTLRPHVESGKVKVLATISSARFALYPDVPGMKEAGFPAYDLNSHQGLAVPKGTPRATINKINAAANAAVLDRTVRDHFLKIGIVLAGGTPEEYQAIINKDVTTFAKLIRDANITIE